MKAWNIVMLGMILAMTSGCAALLLGGAAAGGTAVYLNKVSYTVSVPVMKVRKAAREGMESLGLAVTSERGDAVVSELGADFSDGQHVTVSLYGKTENSTEIVVRVGVVGNTDRAQRVLDAISRRLPQEREPQS